MLKGTFYKCYKRFGNRVPLRLLRTVSPNTEGAENKIDGISL
jgi:hypothetical protein